MKIKRVIKREHPGCFVVEDEGGNQYLVQLAYKLEEWFAALSADDQEKLKG